MTLAEKADRREQVRQAYRQRKYQAEIAREFGLTHGAISYMVQDLKATYGHRGPAGPEKPQCPECENPVRGKGQLCELCATIAGLEIDPSRLDTPPLIPVDAVLREFVAKYGAESVKTTARRDCERFLATQENPRLGFIEGAFAYAVHLAGRASRLLLLNIEETS